MPSLIRLIVTIGILAGLVYGAMYALVAYVEPNPRPMTERIPTDMINPVRLPRPAVVEQPEAETETAN